MKCLYEVEVRAQCPVNKADTDLYEFKIYSGNLINVEKITEFFAKNAGKHAMYQEELTRNCAVTLGVRVTSTGWHSGIKVTCDAP